jgi:hypothetical protein
MYFGLAVLSERTNNAVISEITHPFTINELVLIRVIVL